jgi:uncharacterized protein (TIGR02145 family)
MKQELRKLRWKHLLAGVLIATAITSCKNDEDEPKTIPVVTTAAITEVTTTSAMGGGDITSNGNATVTASGLVYSSSNATPTLTDSKTALTTASGPFSSKLEALASGTTFHVRAYATNSVGTGYGATVDFVTGNAAPIATAVMITGDLEVNKELTATYTYTDPENDPQGVSTFKWYLATDGAGAGETVIAGATELMYTPVPSDEFKYIRVGITAKSTAGTMLGTEVKSAFMGPIAESTTTITFTYNGAEVTYGIITSTVTGRKWMDRNLGASHAATSTQDHLGYGDLFQWGRPADGHQLITWTQDVLVGSSAPVNGVTATLSTTNTPVSSLFITSINSPQDWRNPQNNSLWQAPDFINNPCPSGWHIPTKEEWDAEHVDITNGNELKITANGARRPDNGGLLDNSVGPGRQGLYWSANSVFYDGFGHGYGFYDFKIYDTGEIDRNFRYGTEDVAANGFSCRCIKSSEQ